MPRRLPQSIKLYSVDVSSATILDVLDIAALDRLEHSTELPGGFMRLEFTIAGTEGLYWEWRVNRLLCRIRLEEDGGRVIWEGRVEDIELRDLWTMHIAAYGYWSNFTDAYYNASYNTTGDQIVSDLLTNAFSGNRQVSSSLAHVEAPGVTIDQDYQDDWDAWRILTDSQRGVLAYGNSSNQKMDLAVWEDREVHYKARNPSKVTWLSYVGAQSGGGVDRLPARISWQNVANAVSVTYLSAGTPTRTAFATDQRSIDRYIRRELRIPSIGESASGTANARRDTELALRKDPQQQTDNIVLTRVWDANGIEAPLCRVRAGDVLRVQDFTPVSSSLDAVTLDAYRTFFIEEARCDHATGQLHIRPDREGLTLAALLRRNNIR